MKKHTWVKVRVNRAGFRDALRCNVCNISIEAFVSESPEETVKARHAVAILWEAYPPDGTVIPMCEDCDEQLALTVQLE